MKRFALFIAVFSAMAIVGTAWAGEDKAEPQLRLELDLADGSHIIGIPNILSVPVQTSYAKMDLPLKQLTGIKISDDHETALIDLRNGDKIKGVISLAPIKLETAFGKVSIGIEHVRALTVDLRGWPVPAALKESLVLHYSLDRNEDGKATDGSGKGNHGTVSGTEFMREGRVAGAYLFDGVNDIIDIGAGKFDDLGNATLSMWIKSSRPVANDWIVFEHFVNDSMGLDLRVDGNGVGFNLTGRNGQVGVHTKTFPFDNWAHVVVVLGSGGMSLYCNGELAMNNPACTDTFSQLGSSRCNKIGMTDFSGPHIGGGCFFKGALDEVMIFNRSLTIEEVKQLYDAQK